MRNKSLTTRAKDVERCLRTVVLCACVGRYFLLFRLIDKLLRGLCKERLVSSNRTALFLSKASRGKL